MLFEWAKFERGELILDAACGEGEITVSLSKKGLRAIGVDKSGRNIEEASKKASRKRNKSKFIITDIRQMPFRNSSFDRIVSLDTLEHIKEDTVVFREFHRILGLNGRLIVTVPCTHYCAVELHKGQRLSRAIIQ